MPAASDVTRLLDDIEARQQSVIEELDALLARIEAVIAEYAPVKQAEPSTTPTPPAFEVLAEEGGEREIAERDVAEWEDEDGAAEDCRSAA